MNFSLIIPCYNESKNIPLLLDRCKEVANENEVEVVLVNNGSTDNSADVFNQLLPHYPGCRVVNVKVNQGYGHGILEGLRAAKGEILGWTHADMQTDPQDAIAGLRFFERDAPNQFVKGNRYGRPFADMLFTQGMSIFESILLLKPMWDINAQPTMFHRSFFEKWQNPPLDFSLDLYAYYKAHTESLHIHRFPVRFGERAFGVSHWNVNWKAKWKFIKRTVSFSLELKKRVANDTV